MTHARREARSRSQALFQARAQAGSSTQSLTRWSRGLLAAAALAIGCEGPDPGPVPVPVPAGSAAPGAGARAGTVSRDPGRPAVADGLYLLRLPARMGTSTAALDSLRGMLAREDVAIEHTYSDLVGLAGTVSARATPAQIARLLRELPDLEVRAAVWRYPDAMSCGDARCDPDEAGNGSRDATCSLDCGVRPPRAQRDELQNSWHTTLVGADQLWAETRGDNVHVAVLDTGYDTGPSSVHPDRPQHMGFGYNFPAASPDYAAVDAHGTHVAGIIAAPRNDFGTAGVAPGATIHVYNVFRVSSGRVGAADADIIAGIESAIRNGYNIINMSLGGSRDSEPEHRAIQKALDAGMLVVVAAGNDEDYAAGAIGTAPGHYPGAYPEAFAVGATTRSDAIAGFSSTGATVAVSAPGDGVYSSVPVRQGDRESVTSFTIDGTRRAVTSSAPSGGSGTGTRDAAVAACGFGSAAELDACGVAGKVALIQRGPAGAGMTAIPFTDKITSARMRGAVGVVLYNHRAPDDTTGGGPLENINVGSALPIPVVALDAGDGEYAAAQIRAGKTVTVSIDIVPSDFTDFSGTSMASPVVAGVAALLWARFPALTNVELRQLLAESAIDLGAPGRDDFFGWGRIDARRALAQARPRARCGDGRIDAASEICDGARVRGRTCDDLGFDSVAGGSVQCNRTCTNLDSSGCACVPGRTPFVLRQLLSENVTRSGVLGTLAIYHADLGGKPVRGAYAKVHAQLRGGSTMFDYLVGPSGDSGDIEDFTPYAGTGLPAGDYEFSPVIGKGDARCRSDQPMTPASYVVKVKS